MKILIVEDVTLVAERMYDLSKQYFAPCEPLICHTLTQAKQCILEQTWDLLLLDLNINGENGFDLLKLAVASSFKTIVITANPEKAATAFDYGVLDFVTKPIIEKRFKLAAERFMSDTYNQREQLKYIAVKSKGQLNLLAIEDIAYINAAGNYAEIHLGGEKAFLHDKSLEKLLKSLPAQFVRIHRSYVVPHNKIEKVIKHGGGKYSAELTSGVQVPMSRLVYKEQFAG